MNAETQDVPKLDFKKIFGVNDSSVQGMYGQAHRFYSQGKYNEALDLFRLLILLENSEIKYFMGASACLHMLKEYSSAVQTYMICGIMDPKDPRPHYHAADCHMKLGDKFAAVVSLEMALARAGEKPEFIQLKERAQLLIAGLKEEMVKIKTL